MREPARWPRSRTLRSGCGRACGLCAAAAVARAHVRLRLAQALDVVELQPDLHSVLDAIDATGARRAIITRNGTHAVEHFLAHSETEFHTILTRDFLPPKPAPDSLIHVSKRLGVPLEELVMVGTSRRAAGAPCHRRA